jgi:hypothetical protein
MRNGPGDFPHQFHHVKVNATARPAGITTVERL